MHPIRFIQEQIEAIFIETPTLEKKPGCPNGFVWREESYKITELLSEWHDYRRRGRMASNMRPTHAALAETKGSWGVGQDYFRIRTDSDRIFDIYYDRAPKDVNNRKGAWFLFQELRE